MKKLFCMLAVLGIVFGASMLAGAVSVDGDASYLFGLGEAKGQGFAVHAQVEVIADIFADAAFSTISFKGEGGNKGPSDTLLNLGGLYRVANEDDLQVFVGGGYAMLTRNVPEATDATKGNGLYGKFGFKLIAAPKLTLVADVAYAPRFKVDGTNGSLTTARATVAYEVMENISVQGTVKHYKSGSINGGFLVGGGIAVTF